MSGSITRRPLLLCSLGNPGASFRHTRHNAGHVMLEMFQIAMRFPPSQYCKQMRGNTTRLDSISLFQSGAYMNESGPSILYAFREFRKTSPEGLLCVIHDEMESKLGTVKVRHSGKGKGHNGIRSCIKALGTEDFARMAIGIDRPASRDSSIVTQWVLGKFTTEEKRTLEVDALMKLIAAVEKLQLM